MRRYLLDTGIIGDFIDRRRGVAGRVDLARTRGDRVGTCGPVIGELWFGVERSVTRELNRDRLIRGLARIPKWPIEDEAAQHFGRICQELRLFVNLRASAGKTLPRHPVPVILLARLAVDQSVQGQKLGEGLLLDVFDRTSAMAAELGIHATEVRAIDEPAKRSYEKYGFAALLDSELHLLLSIATIRDARRG